METMKKPARLTGAEVRALRKRLQMTQATLANTLGISETILSRWENNHSRPGNSLSAALRRLQAEHQPTRKAVKV